MAETITAKTIEDEISRLGRELKKDGVSSIEMEKVGGYRTARALVDLAAAQQGGTAEKERSDGVLRATFTKDEPKPKPEPKKDKSEAKKKVAEKKAETEDKVKVTSTEEA